MRIHFSFQSLAAGTVIGEEKRYPAGHARLAYLQTLATCRNRIVTQPFRTCSAIHFGSTAFSNSPFRDSHAQDGREIAMVGRVTNAEIE